MTGPDLNIICWNVRGLNTPARRTTVQETLTTTTTLTSTTGHLACLQETILEMIDQTLALYLGGHNLCSYAQKPAVGIGGRILLLWNDDFIETG